MIEGNSNIISWFESTGTRFWWIFNRGGTSSGQWVARSDHNDGATTSSAMDELKKALALHRSGQFTLVANEAPVLTAKGNYRTDIEINHLNQNQSIGNIIPMQKAIDDDEIQKRINDAIDKYKTDRELKEAKEKVGELEKELKEFQKNDPWAKLAGIATQYLPMYLAGEKAKVAGIPAPSAPPDVHYENENNDERELEIRLGKVIEIFQQHDPDWLNTLERMAAKVQQQPQILQTLKAFI